MGHLIEKEPERAILCAVSLPGKTEHTERSIEELGRLAETADAVVVDQLIQSREKIHRQIDNIKKSVRRAGSGCHYFR